MHAKKEISLFDKTIAGRALIDSFKKLHPRTQARNPVIMMVTVGALFTTVLIAIEAAGGRFSPFTLQIALWLWFTTLFANFAEAIAEGRGKARADSLRAAKTKTVARLLVNGKESHVHATELTRGDVVVCEAGDMIPGDGEVIEGIASVDESAITGESAPVIRESGGDRSAVTAGTRVLSDRIIIRITSSPGNTFLDRMIALIEGASRKKTPNEIALTILLSALSFIFLLVTVTLYPFVSYSATQSGASSAGEYISVPVLIALLVCLIPTTISGLLSAIGISGMDRLIRHNVIAMSGKAAEAAGDIDVLLLDKTGTITLGNRMATDFIPADGVDVKRLASAAQLASLSDETPEGRSIVVLAKDLYALRADEVKNADAKFIPFSAQTSMSGVDIVAQKGPVRSIRKGSEAAITGYLAGMGVRFPLEVHAVASTIAQSGGTPLVVAEGRDVLGTVHLKDVVKGGIRERFASLRRMGIRTVMITGDNPLTAAAIAAEAGVDDFIAQATPETKLLRIREEQEKGHMAAMIGDGTNDAPALAQSDVGVAMSSGTQTAREAGNMVDLDSNPTKLIEIVEIGKQLLMTRGALTTFSIANDVAKYFAILPAIFGGLYAAAGGTGTFAALNIMGLSSPEGAILAAVIFNALIIIALIPLALRGVAYRPIGANAILGRNLLLYGLGGLIAPFIGIKLIYILIVFLNLV